MRMHSVTSTIENGFVHLPEKAAWLAESLYELTSFPQGNTMIRLIQSLRHWTGSNNGA